MTDLIQPSDSPKATAIAVAASLVGVWAAPEFKREELETKRDAFIKWQQDKIVEIAKAILAGVGQ